VDVRWRQLPLASIRPADSSKGKLTPFCARQLSRTRQTRSKHLNVLKRELIVYLRR